MATFKAGQRVRIVGVIGERYAHLVGREGQVTAKPAINPNWYSVSLGLPNSGGYDGWEFPSYCLAPLTPPQADTWASDKVRELTKPKPMDLEREPQKVKA